MSKIDMINKLYEFHTLSDEILRKAGQNVPEDGWNDRNNSKQILRRRLIEEEVTELLEAMLYKTREEVAKELADVLYVVIPVAFLYDIPIEAVFNRVHKNNMLKLKNAIVRSDGKILKNPNHPKVNLKDLFDE